MTEPTTNNVEVRAIYRAVAVDGKNPPYDRAVLKVYYPAERCDSDWERNTGMVPPSPALTNWPVVIMMPGANVSPEGFSWLVTALASQGIACVTYHYITEEIPDFVCLSPGMDISQLSKADYGKQPSAMLVRPILNELVELNSNGMLAGKFDLSSLFFGGHSAGGAAALYNSNPDWFPGIKGCFCYGAHTGASPSLDWDEGTVINVDPRVPYLLLAGSHDGVIAASGHRYGDSGNNSCTARIEQTFEQGITSNRADSHLVILDGANHFSFAAPYDFTTGRAFLDKETKHPQHEYQAFMQNLILQFIQSQLDKNSNVAEQDFKKNLTHPIISEHRCK